MEQNPIQNTGKMETSRNYPDGVPCFEDHLNGLQLHVRDLSFCPPISLFHRVTDWIQPYLRKIQQTKSATHINSCLQNVNFTCYGGELTAVVGNDDERSSLIHLLAGRLTTGEFDGDIVLTSPCMSSKSYYYDNVTFVQKKPLYLHGLTFYQMLRYSVELKLKPRPGVDMSKFVEERTEQLIKLLKLENSRHRVIEDYPDLRGESGFELRRLSIALEIVDLPPLIVVDEPTWSFNPAMSVVILECLQSIASQGHIVVCSMTKPFMKTIDLLNKMVVLSGGYNIFANNPKKLVDYFCNPTMGYEFRKGTDMVEFVLDIANGTERPTTQRTADSPHIMHERYLSSEYYQRAKLEATASCSAFSPRFFYLWGYGNFVDWSFERRRIATVIKRAIHTKFNDSESNRQQFAIAVFGGGIIGYLQWNQGSFGNYCMSMLNFTYPNTANLSCLIFFISMLSWSIPWLNVHSACQKLQVYRYEQKSGCCTSLAFILSAIIAEFPPSTISVALLFSILFFMVNLDNGFNNYLFFVCAGVLNSTCGLLSSYFVSAVLRKELRVRDTYIVLIAIVATLSGFAFQIPSMYSYFVPFANLLSTRWTFTAFMNWKFMQYEDGPVLLKPYGSATFHHLDVFSIYGKMIMVLSIFCALALQKGPLLLRRKLTKNKQQRQASNDSVDSIALEVDVIPEKTVRRSESIIPLLFSRYNSVTGGTTKLSFNVTTRGDEENHQATGPSLMFKNITLRVKCNSHPTGYKTIINKVSGQFDWGKLSLILGGSGAGKTSLLHVLAGDFSVESEITGCVRLNKKPINYKDYPWQRCGFVTTASQVHEDLTVKELLTFALKLRCLDTSPTATIIQENITRTVEILRLNHCIDRKAKHLNPGEWKRLCIAEEIIHGPMLLLVDEPTTGINLIDTAILMSCFREMVNQNRTVIVSMYQPPAEVFQLFDTLLLLSNGRVIYYGNVSSVLKHFTSNPFQFSMAGYSNPADFVVDIANCVLRDTKMEEITSSLMESYYLQSSTYSQLMKRFEAPAVEDVAVSPMVKDENITLDSTTNEIADEIIKQGEVEIFGVVRLFVSDILSCFNINSGRNNFRLMVLLFERNLRSLVGRYELIVGSLLISILLACLFGWVMGDCSGLSGLYNVVSFLAIASMFLIFSNVFFGRYMFNNHQVYLKEYSRGLYSNSIRWLSSDFAIYALRGVNGLVFCSVAWGITDLPTDSDTFGFSLLMFMIFMVVCVLLCECAVFIAPDLLSVYVATTGLALMNFAFSSLFIKFQSLPSWLAPWAPSLSMIRWNLQGNFLNLYNGTFAVSPGGFSTYALLLRLYGWGGKSPWYCMRSLLIIGACYKLVSFITGGVSGILRKGGKMVSSK